MLQELILIKEFFCPICQATDLLILQDPEIANRFIITRVDSIANQDTKLIAAETLTSNSS